MKKIYSIFIVIFLQAITVSAQTTFQKTFGGTTAEWGNAVLQLNDGRYIIAGSTNSFGAGNYDFYLIQLAANGDTLWTKTYGGAQNDIATALQQTIDGGYIIVGNSANVSAGSSDICLVRTDSSGNLLWTKNYGGAEADEGYSVRQTADSGFIVSGNSLSFSSNFTSDAILIKTNSLGDTVWTRVISAIFDDFGYSVLQTSDGGYILLGVTTSFGPGTYDIFVIKFSSTGLFQFARTYGAFAFEYSFTILEVTGGYVIAGHTNSFGEGDMDMYLFKIDVFGNVLWSRTYGEIDTDVPYSAAQTSDGGFILAGATRSFGAGDNDYYLVRTDSSGTLLWSKAYGGTGTDESYSVRQTNDGGYILNGHSYNFGAGLSDMYVIKTDSSGNSDCNETNPATIAGTAATQVLSFSVAFLGGIMVFNPAFVTGSGSAVSTLCLVVTGNEQTMENENQISYFPNPAKGELRIKNGELKIEKVEIYNVLGEKAFQLQTSDLKAQTLSIDVSSFVPGIYFVKVGGEKHESMFKMIKE